jgi:hypothetical protein
MHTVKVFHPDRTCRLYEVRPDGLWFLGKRNRDGSIFGWWPRWSALVR